MRSRAPLILSLAVVSVLFIAATMVVDEVGSEDVNSLFLDMYELTGSRLTGVVSIVGVMLLVATSAISLFAARLAWGVPGRERWARYLLGAGLVTAVLAIDDYLSVHEFADDVLEMATGLEASRPLKNLLEAGVLGVYGLLLLALLWRFRQVVMEGEWVLLAIAAALLLGSLALDLAPHSWLEGTLSFSMGSQAVVEDTLKLTGLAFYATFFVRASAQTVRSAHR